MKSALTKAVARAIQDKVVGTTGNGYPIYRVSEPEHYKDYSETDHIEAANTHLDLAEKSEGEWKNHHTLEAVGHILKTNNKKLFTRYNKFMSKYYPE